jgi:hypothetical protein
MVKRAENQSLLFYINKIASIFIYRHLEIKYTLPEQTLKHNYNIF